MHSQPKTRFDVSRTIGRWPSILAHLGVPASVLSKHNGPCPFCDGKDRFRFTDKDGAGVWICNQCGTGNGFHFVERWENTNFVGACKIIESALPHAKVAHVPAPQDNRKKLNALWASAKPITDGDPVSLYLARRKLMLPGNEVRTALSLAFWDRGQILGRYPAMVARVRGGNGKPSTLHVTYLTEDGRKADVPVSKKVLSMMAVGSHVRLAPLEESRLLCVTEGIETGLAVQEMSGLPTWALLSAGNMEKFELPEQVTTLAIWADNDHSYTGQKHAYALANRIVARHGDGVGVTVMLPPCAGLDWADVLQSRKEAP